MEFGPQGPREERERNDEQLREQARNCTNYVDSLLKRYPRLVTDQEALPNKGSKQHIDPTDDLPISIDRIVRPEHFEDPNPRKTYHIQFNGHKLTVDPDGDPTLKRLPSDELSSLDAIGENPASDESLDAILERREKDEQEKPTVNVETMLSDVVNTLEEYTKSHPTVSDKIARFFRRSR